MTLRTAALTTSAVAFAGVLASATAIAQSASPWNALAGEWKLNASLSDARPASDSGTSERPPMRGGGPPSGGGGEMGRGREMGGGPGGGRQGGGPGGPGGRGRGKPPEGRPPAPGGATSLLIGLQEGGVRVSTGGDNIRILTVGGPPVERKRGPATVTETVTWESGALTVRSSAPETSSTIETLSVGEDGRLTCSVTLPARGDREEKTMRWVYDRVPAAKESKG